MAFDAGFGNVAALGASLAMMALAIVLMAIGFSNRLHQALALLLVCNAVYIGAIGFGETPTALATRFRLYFLIAIPFAAVAFALVYLGRHGGPGRLRRQGWIGLAILAAALACEWLYWRDHGLLFDGPFRLFYAFPSLTFAVLTVQMLIDHRSAPQGRRRQSFFLAALGFSIQPVYEAFFHLMGPVGELFLDVDHDHLGNTWLFLSDALRLVPIGILVVALAVLFRPAKQGEGPKALRGRRRALLMFWGLAAAVGVADAVAFRVMTDDLSLWSQYHRLTNATAVLVGLALITYAMVRHQLFDVDLRVRWAIKNSSVVAIFLAAFFVVAQLVQNIANEMLGYIGGAIAAGLLLFVLTPVQRAAERLAVKATPGSRPVSEMGRSERHAIYREQLEIAWSDGTLNRKERLQFERLRRRLGVSAEEALDMESETLSRSAPKGGGALGESAA